MQTHRTTYLVPPRTIVATPLSVALAATGATAPAALLASPTIAWAEPRVQAQEEATPDKTETVYAYADATGSVRSVEVEARLANKSGSATLFDQTDLTNIEVTSAGSAYSTGDSGGLVWTSDGEDVTYEGTSTKEPPLHVHVSYLLDGREVSPDELLGASGRVTIRYDYENSTRGTTRVNGYSDRVLTPFLAITGISLDPTRFSNVSVTNGRIMEEAGSLVVVGYALPGLKESLGDDLEDLEVPDFFELSADVTDFQIGETLTLVTPDLLSDIDTDGIDFSEFDDAMDAMHEAMSALGDGAGQLAQGMDELSDGAGALDDGMAQFDQQLSQLGDASALTDGASQLTSLVDQLETGATQAANGASNLASGLQQLKDGTDSAAAAAGGLSDAASGAKAYVDEANDGLSSLSQGIEAGKDAAAALLGDASGSIDEATAAVASGEVAEAATAARAAADTFEGASSEADALASQAVAAQEAADILSSINTEGMKPDQVKAIEDARARLGEVSVGSLTDYGEAAADAAEKLDAAATRLDAAREKLEAAAGSVTDANASVADISSSTEGTSTALATASTILGQTADGAASLRGALEGASSALGSAQSSGSLIGSASSLGAGMQQMADGISSRRADMAGLAAALSTLGTDLPQAAAGAAALHQGTAALSQGADAIADGASQLADGIGQFDEEGVSKLADELDSHIGGLADRIDAISGAARDYTNFSGLADGQTGSVRFIYKVDAIEPED